MQSPSEIALLHRIRFCSAAWEEDACLLFILFKKPSLFMANNPVEATARHSITIHNPDLWSGGIEIRNIY